MGISFVAAGTLSPEELLKPTIANPEDKDSSAEENAEFTADVTESSPSSTDKSPESNGEETTAQIDVGKLNLGPVEEEAPRQEVSGFVLDLTGDATVDPKIKNPTIRAPSPSPSVSSTASERIVFVPKSKRGGILQSKSTMQQLSPRPKPTKTPSVPTRIESTPNVVKTTESTTITTSISVSQTEDKPSKPAEAEDFIKLNGQSQWNGKRATPGNKRRKPQGEKRGRGRKTADQEAIKDYIENIAAQMRAEAAEDAGGETSMDGAGLLRDIGGDDWVDDSSTDEDDAASDSDVVRMYKNGGWDSDRIRDFEDFSTDDQKPRGLIASLLGKRIRPSGLQYLIKWDGYETDDATWTLAKTLDSSSDAKVKRYEEKLAKIAAQTVESSSSGSSDGSGDEEDDDDDDDDDGEVDEEEDRKLAKLLQRQEELMMMGVEDDLDEVMDLEDDFFPMGIGKKSKKKRKSRQNIPDITVDPSTGHFPSATKMAAAYDTFDVMDWERPSIATGRKRKGKGRMAQLNLSDSELEVQITNTWERDRQSKKLRKIRREELRAQGMLGAKVKKTGKANMLDKYKEGMTMTQIYDEIRTFMLKGHTTLSLPPMTKKDRKTVHELAQKLNLKSKSIGNGKYRFTTIIKTSASGIYEHDEEAVDSIMRSGRFAKRMDVGRGRAGKGNGGGGGGGKRNKDGMVVGAEAPELSATNKGRLMLEKMGYKTGMSLGVEGNQGISEPVVAIIKMSKAGLG
ncbi:hypothetical protein K440DRAFT_640416 [Wilcoxina mikolae CBS 423.85]|nr:hypothetical protein K440DRAFT_640416 [Wilcoxina mikolae CBS 423.85]